MEAVVRRLMRGVALTLAFGFSVAAEIVDRVAVTVDKIVITTSDILSHVRVAAFLNEEPPDLSPAARRAAAQRLVEQALVQREMEILRYPAPSGADVDAVLEQLRRRANSPDAFQARLAEYGITEVELRRSLLRQIMTLRFIDFRFRPGVAVTDAEIEAYYRDEFLPTFLANGRGAPPPLEEAREEIEEILIGRRVDEALDRWLTAAAAQAAIEYREEAFQ